MGRYLGELGTDTLGVTIPEYKVGRVSWTAAQAIAPGACHAAITSNGSTTVTTTTAFTQPVVARNLVITPGGTTASVKAASITVNGTNLEGQVISEAFAFAENATAATTGAKAFKTVTSVVIPAQDGADATFTVTTGAKLGLPVKMASNQVFMAKFGTTHDSALPTVAFSSTALESNTATFATTLDGTACELYLVL